MRADHAQTAGIIGAAVTDLGLTGYIVEVQPTAVLGLYDALCTQDRAIFFFVSKLAERLAKTFFGKALRGLNTDVVEHFISIMAVMMVMMMLVIVIMMVIVVMMMLVMMLMLVFVVVIMMMLMMVFVLILVMLMMVMMLMLIFILILVIVIMVMFMMMLMIMMMVLMLVLFFFLFVFIEQVCDSQKSGRVLDGLKDHLRIKLIPGSCNDACLRILLCNKCTALFHALGGKQLGSAEDNGFGALDLIDEEFTEVLHIDAAAAGIYDSSAAGHF